MLKTLILPLHELGSRPIILSISHSGLMTCISLTLWIGLGAHVISPKETQGSLHPFHGSMMDYPIKALILHEMGKNKTKQNKKHYPMAKFVKAIHTSWRPKALNPFNKRWSIGDNRKTKWKQTCWANGTPTRETKFVLLMN